MIYRLWRQIIMKQNKSNGDSEFTGTIGLGGKWANYWRQTKNNLENGEEYARLIKTPYHNLMLDKQVLKTNERLAGHRLFLPQKVVRCEIWIGGL